MQYVEELGVTTMLLLCTMICSALPVVAFKEAFFFPYQKGGSSKNGRFYIRLDSTVHREVSYPEVSEWITDQERADYVLLSG